MDCKVKIILVDSDSGGFRELYSMKKSQAIKLVELSPNCISEIDGYFDFLQKLIDSDEAHIEYRVSTLEDVVFFNNLIADYIIDLRNIGEEIAESITIYALRG